MSATAVEDEGTSGSLDAGAPASAVTAGLVTSSELYGRGFLDRPYTGRVPALEQLSRRYREHHATRSPDFVYGGDERAELIGRYVGGPGRRVLDVGCRYGALTRSYLAGNEVVGLDVDRLALEEAARLGVGPLRLDAETRRLV